MIYDAEKGNISIAVAGDAMITRRMRGFSEPKFLELVELLRGTDLSIANLEMLFHEYEHSWQFHGGTPTRSSPRNLDELKWMGIDLVTTATNHAYDFSEGGLLTTIQNCDYADLPNAGAGRNIDEARAPAYFDTPGGRVAVMAAASTFSEQSRAGAGRPDFSGKPGVNALRHDKTHLIERDVFDALTKANSELGYTESAIANQAFGFSGKDELPDPSTEIRFLQNKFLLSEEFSVTTKVNEEDREGNRRWIRGASKQADWLVYCVHSHESGQSGDFHGGERTSPAEFLEEFAHWAIDEGCDMFVAHGPHFLRGIEIYKGKPIFYSLGNFIFQNETVEWIPDEGYRRFHLSHDSTPGDYLESRSDNSTRGFPSDPWYWRSVVGVCNYREKQLEEIRLYPIDLGFARPISQRGRPVLAQGDVARDTLESLRDLSRPMGTDIKIEGGVGIIRM